MRGTVWSAIFILAVLAAGCSINTKALKKDMGPKDVILTLGYPQEMCRDVLNGKRVEVWDYERETLGVPNPIDDYWYLIPPSMKVARLWFVEGKLKDWQEGKFRNLDELHKLDNPPQWQAPPDFRSQALPQCIRDLSIPPIP